MRKLIWVVALASVAATGCVGPRTMEEGLPASVIAVYDAATPDGWMEIEASRDGRILGVEADIPVETLPASIVAAAERELPGGEITGAEVEYMGDRRGREVKKTVDGVAWELVFSKTGRLIETEKTITAEDAPAVVMRAAEATVPGGELKSVELVMRGEHEEYHVKFARDGASYKVVLDPDGIITRHVREAKVELEIPVR